MDFSNQEIKTIQKALLHWQEKTLLTHDHAKELEAAITKNANNKLAPLSIYAFIIAASSAVLAFASLIIDAKWLEKIRLAWSFSELFISVVFLLIAGVLVGYTIRNKKKAYYSKLSNEIFNLGIFFCICISITYLGRSFGWQDNYFTSEMAIITMFSFVIAWLLSSKLLWLIALIVATVWFCTQTYFWQDATYRFWGMNYPLRCSLWSVLVLVVSMIIKKINVQFFKPTYSFGIITLLIATWTLSFFGNWSSIEKWEMVQQGKLWYWAAIYTILILVLFFIAIKWKIDFLRDVSIAFFIINLYTRYFEYFWDKTNKGIFFAILAISFWIIGRQIEKIRIHTT